VAQHHVARPGHVTRWDRCIAMGYSAWDMRPSTTHKPPRDLFRRVVREACTVGITRGIVPRAGSPLPGTPEWTEFQQLLLDVLVRLSRS